MSEVKDPKIKLFGKTIELPENSAALGDDGGELCSARSCEPAVRVSSRRDPPSSSDSMVEDSIYLSSGDAEEQEPEPVKTPSTHEKNNTKEDDESVSGLLKLDEPRDPTARTDPNNTAARNMASKLPETGGGSTEKPVPNHPPARKTAPEHEQQLPEPGGSNEKAPKKPDKILPCPRCNSTDTKFCYFNNYNVNQPRHFCKNCQRYWTAGGTMRNVPVGAGLRKNKSSSAAAAFHHNCPSSPPNGGTVIAFGGPVSTDHTGRPGSKNEPIRPELESRVQPPPGPPVQVPCYPGQTQWAYHPWNSVAWGPFYPATLPPYWGWSVPPYVVPAVGPGSWPSPPMLGKHSREEEAAESDPNKQCLWVPKTLRIDDPREAAKSSIWATLGIANETGAEPGKGCLFGAFGAFGAKGDSESHLSEASTVLQANPAAMSRAVSFHESS